MRIAIGLDASVEASGEGLSSRPWTLQETATWSNAAMGFVESRRRPKSAPRADGFPGNAPEPTTVGRPRGTGLEQLAVVDAVVQAPSMAGGIAAGSYQVKESRPAL